MKILYPAGDESRFWSGEDFILSNRYNKQEKKIKNKPTLVSFFSFVADVICSGGNTNGVFRLGGGAKRTPARHLPLGDHRAMGAHTVGDDETSGSTSGDAEMGDPSRIPAFASTSSLGEPVPFPHRYVQVCVCVDHGSPFMRFSRSIHFTGKIMCRLGYGLIKTLIDRNKTERVCDFGK